MSVQDGPGIRTMVFFKGCPLRCVWCHNPESQSFSASLGFRADKCIGCGRCATACDIHSFADGAHEIDRARCTGRGTCVSVCPTGALELYGREASVEELMEEILRDRAFYGSSGGGLTVSGGEPLCQPDFLYELLSEAKKVGLHTCIETCGLASSEALRSIAPLTDLFLFDFKESDDSLHKEYTGVSNRRILDNLHLLDRMGRSIVLRCPIIPTLNDRTEHLDAIADLAGRLDSVIEINVMAYHTLGNGKYEELGLEYGLPEIAAMTEEQKRACIEHIEKRLLLTYGKQITVK